MELVFLKLGGSLITDKDSPNTARIPILQRLGAEIYSAIKKTPQIQLVIGHGSGSFGHTPAKKYNTRAGVNTSLDWKGFAEVWNAARALNQIVIKILSAAELPVIAIPPSAVVSTRSHSITEWNLHPIQAALSAGLIPIVYGDVVFDEECGGTILSTEELFFFLAPRIEPHRILLAGIEPGVWADYPACTRLVDTITPKSLDTVQANLKGSASVDVTGGMLAKVRAMLDLAKLQPGLEINIFSGFEPGNVERALLGNSPGTRLTARS